MPDLLEMIWLEAINVDAAGKWMNRVFRELGALQSVYSNCGPALQRLKKLGSAEDIGRISRFVRYETCFGILYSLDDPGFSKQTSFAPIPLLEAALPGKRATKKLSKFLLSVKETLSIDDDGEWLAALANEKQSDAPFDDAGAAVKRLLNRGASVGDLAQLAIWSRYEACEQAFRLLDEAGLEHPDETSGLYESLLGSDPSGKEGRPGSWPMLPDGKAKGKKAVGISNEPLWKLRSGQAIDFSPDGKTLAVGSASGPARLYNALTGKEQLVCEGIKAHIYRVAFSPDGKRLAVADINQRLTICDTITGKVLAKTKFPEHEIRALVYSVKTGDLLRSTWSEAIDVIDPTTAKLKKPFYPAPNVHMVHALKFFSKGDRILTVWTPKEGTKRHVTVWSWPERARLLSFEIPDYLIMNVAVAVSPNGKHLAMAMCPSYFKPDTMSGVMLFDCDNGKPIKRIKLTEARAVAFLPNGVLMAADIDDLHFFEPNTWLQIREIKGSGDAYDMAVSPDGKLVAITQFGGVRVWRS